MRKTYLIALVVLSVFIAITIYSYVLSDSYHLFKKPVIKVGILHSLTGDMAISERPVIDATLLAIEEVNLAGGVMGMQVVPVIADGRSDSGVFRKEAERLITKDGVKVIFGCWTSASRKAVKPVVEGYGSILFYPVQYEGLEESGNIIYMGAAPNQQLIPAIKWAHDNLGKKFFLVGSDYVFPRVANGIAKILLDYIGGEVVGEEYATLDTRDFSDIVKKIKDAKPDVILNTINGDANVAFFAALHKFEIESDDIAIMSLSVTENEVQAIRDKAYNHNPEGRGLFVKKHLAKTYTCWNYFESIDNLLNMQFISKFKKRFGNDYRVNDPMEASYLGVHLWAEAVNEAKDINNASNIINHLHHLSMRAPEGIITIADNNHAQKTIRIGRLNENMDFDIIWTSKYPITPMPYPYFRSKSFWERFLESLYVKWNKHWSRAEHQASDGVGQ